MSEISPLIPVYRRGKNRLIDITERDFDDNHGHFAKLRVARYYDKNNAECEIVLQVMWIASVPPIRDK